MQYSYIYSYIHLSRHANNIYIYIPIFRPKTGPEREKDCLENSKSPTNSKHQLRLFTFIKVLSCKLIIAILIFQAIFVILSLCSLPVPVRIGQNYYLQLLSAGIKNRSKIAPGSRSGLPKRVPGRNICSDDEKSKLK